MPSAALEVLTLDASVVDRLMGVAAPSPGLRREVHSGAVLLFVGGRTRAGASGQTFTLQAEYGSANVAAVLANWLWNQLHGHVTELRVAGQEVPLQHAAIKQALLDAAE